MVDRIRIPAGGKIKHDSDALIDQVRAVDNRRLTAGPLARCSPALMQTIGAALREVMDLE